MATFRTDGSRETSGNAVIEEDDRAGGFAFAPVGDESEYEAWLRRLCSST